MNGEVLRLVRSLHREKDIDEEIVFQGIEAALLSAARKYFGSEEELSITIDRETGQVIAMEGTQQINPSELGRIAAQTAKQVMIQKIREAECDSITRDFSNRLMTLISGAVQRFEGPNIIVNLGRTEGFLPRSEQLPNESYHVGERIRCLILDVKAVGTKVRVLLSRSHADLVRKLFDMEVPEVAENIVVIKAIAREAGYRTKIAVYSTDPKVDCVGACVGVQGTRIKSIVDELNGEKIDIIRWSDSPEMLISNTLKPAEIAAIELDYDTRHAFVIVPEEQLSLAIGRRGQNVRLAAKLNGWEIDIKTQAEYDSELATEEALEEGEENVTGAAPSDETTPEAPPEPKEVAEEPDSSKEEALEEGEENVTEAAPSDETTPEAPPEPEEVAEEPDSSKEEALGEGEENVTEAAPSDETTPEVPPEPEEIAEEPDSSKEEN